MTATTPPNGWLDLGDTKVIPLVEIPRLLINPAEFFPELQANGTEWWARSPWIDEDTKSLIYVIQAFLVASPSGITIIDAGVGAGKSRTRPAFNNLSTRWADSLKSIGVDHADVGTVILTHLHVDHVGGATTHGAQSWEPEFPNADYLLSHQEFDYWHDTQGQNAVQRTGDYIADSITPLADAGQLTFISPDTQVSDNIWVRDATGHTPGLLSVEIIGQDASVLIASDIAHHPLQLDHPEMGTRYCVDKEQAARTRIDTFNRSAETGLIILPAHFAGQPGGRISISSQGAFEWNPAAEIWRTGNIRV